MVVEGHYDLLNKFWIIPQEFISEFSWLKLLCSNIYFWNIVVQLRESVISDPQLLLHRSSASKNTPADKVWSHDVPSAGTLAWFSAVEAGPVREWEPWGKTRWEIKPPCIMPWSTYCRKLQWNIISVLWSFQLYLLNLPWRESLLSA